MREQFERSKYLRGGMVVELDMEGDCGLGIIREERKARMWQFSINGAESIVSEIRLGSGFDLIISSIVEDVGGGALEELRGLTMDRCVRLGGSWGKKL